MRQVAIALLQLPDYRIVLQRRDDSAPTSPGKLGFFGGHIESGEDPKNAISRELKEETSLNISSLDIKNQGSFKLTFDTPGGKEIREYYLYKVLIKDNKFDVHEGVRSETYTAREALERDDLTRSAKRVLKQL